MQYLAQGLAFNRARLMGRCVAKQIPYVPLSIRARASSISRTSPRSFCISSSVNSCSQLSLPRSAMCCGMADRPSLGLRLANASRVILLTLPTSSRRLASRVSRYSAKARGLMRDLGSGASGSMILIAFGPYPIQRMTELPPEDDALLPADLDAVFRIAVFVPAAFRLPALALEAFLPLDFVFERVLMAGFVADRLPVERFPVARLAVDRFEVDFRAARFLPEDFFLAVFLASDFLAARFFTDFFTAVFLPDGPADRGLPARFARAFLADFFATLARAFPGVAREARSDPVVFFFF